MTTIVYCHKTKQIACDSRATAGWTISNDDAIKWINHGSEFWFFAGSVPDIYNLIDMHEKKIKPFNIDAYAIVASKEGVFCRGFDSEKGRYLPYELTSSWAIGSGRDHALTALDMGGSVRTAIEMSIKRDIASGGKIRVFDCLGMEFIDEAT